MKWVCWEVFGLAAAVRPCAADKRNTWPIRVRVRDAVVCITSVHSFMTRPRVRARRVECGGSVLLDMRTRSISLRF